MTSLLSRRPLGALLLLTVAALAMQSRVACAAETPKEELLWPADHAANQGEKPAAPDSLDWSVQVANSPTLTYFLPEKEKRNGTAMVICPGGAYVGLAMQKEGHEVAEWCREHGIVGVVLRYRCGGGKNLAPVPLQDVQQAIRTVRAHAKELGVDPNKIGVCGFSAGGHLASTAATMFDDGDAKSSDPIAQQSSRPDFAVLVYPVITLVGDAAHRGSRANLLGGEASEELAEEWSTDRRVTDKTPPTFLVHATDDDGVVPKNSILFYEALRANKVPAEMHIYEVGGHGFGMLRDKRPADLWPNELEAWLKARGITP
ncbi:alpha/beta hydrolase [Lacipirellula sp.]|uniref:alpha/beta hydrolase n=1 Tax=Lacipirellula sp. TaxID=2691419 RepID=UPI003D0BAAE6